MVDIVGVSVVIIAAFIVLVIGRFIVQYCKDFVVKLMYALFYLLMLYCFVFTAYAHWAPIDMNQMHNFLVFRDNIYSTITTLRNIELPTTWSLLTYTTQFLAYMKQ